MGEKRKYFLVGDFIFGNSLQDFVAAERVDIVFLLLIFFEFALLPSSRQPFGSFIVYKGNLPKKYNNNGTERIWHISLQLGCY